jgi:peptidoglycan/xylan/chitin deacetylase (PgdA/CDA1 family)
VILRRGAAAASFLVACVAVLQVGDSIGVIPQTPVSPVVEAQVPFGMSTGSDHEFFLSHTQMIPIGRRSIRVPILMYHYIRSAPSMYRDRLGWNLTVTPADFQTQMGWLSAHGYHPVDFNDLRAYFGGRAPLPSKPVVITFDDGYQDLYTTAYPILSSHNFKAVAYIVTSFVGRSRYVTADEVVEMDRHGIEIASHTVDHADLARTSIYWATFQLATSRAWLQNLVKHPVVDFAFPSGKFNATAISALQATGYDTAVTEIPGTVHSRADRYTWTRVRVGGGEVLSDFISNLGTPEPAIDVSVVTTDPKGGTTSPG